ncbi:hypothetical protein [Arthrobacter sp. Bi26]|uniref:hypothetical protein n=1 Tax=Arthrobacter sp. Bi26 TaxID=2822350 RepID=UPI001E5C5DAA|nr:hypothetical protein [Arthrobacter sp. Bi26]
MTAALASVITEAIAWFLGLRAKFLLEGIKSLVDGDDSEDVIDFRNVKANYDAFRKLVNPTSTPRGFRKLLHRSTKLAAPTFTSASPTLMPASPTSPTSALLGGPILGHLGLLKPLDKIQKKGAGKGKVVPPPAALRQYPSYFSSRAFSAAVLDLLLPDTPGSTTPAKISEIRSSVEKIENKALKESLLGILKSTEEDLEKLHQAIEQWYDDHMDRVSGWYKRHVSWITILAGAVLVILLNVNTIAIARTLYTDADTRTAVAAIVNSKPCEQNDETCIDKLTREATALTASGLPLAWRWVPADCPESEPECSSWWSYNDLPDINRGLPSFLFDILLLLAGWGVTVIALLPGARFWYDLLNRIGGLNKGSPSYAGPKPPQATKS